MSGGEQQRLFLVLALLNRPRLVILDELTQGLDPAARREVWSAVAQLRDAGTTVLLVTHELDEAEALCDRVVAMRAGRVLDAGTPGRAGRPARRRAPRSGSGCRPAARPATSPGCADLQPASGDVVRTRRDQVAVCGDRRRDRPRRVPGWSQRGPIPTDLRVEASPTSRPPCSPCSTRPHRPEGAAS